MRGNRLPPLTKIFIRTVTYFYVGSVVAETDDALTIRHAAWVVDTGPFTRAMATGEFAEVELYPPDMEVGIMWNAVVDCVLWPHALPEHRTP